MFKHILVPTDGSELSGKAVQQAIQFARETGARITFFYAKPDYPVVYYGEGALIDPTTPEKFAELTENQAREILGAAEKLAREAGVGGYGTLATTHNVPYEAIISAESKKSIKQPRDLYLCCLDLQRKNRQ